MKAERFKWLSHMFAGGEDQVRQTPQVCNQLLCFQSFGASPGICKEKNNRLDPSTNFKIITKAGTFMRVNNRHYCMLYSMLTDNEIT